MPHLDPARWHRLSALLDQALDLDPGGRAALLASLRETSPDVAESLHDFLVELDQVAGSRFLETEPEMTELPFPCGGQTIGAYALDRPLGAGGMGAVWLGRRSDGRFEGQVAIKLLNLALLDARGQERFRLEGAFRARPLAHRRGATRPRHGAHWNRSARSG